ncbi:polyprenyl synthetase family protein [Microbacterium sp. cf332]|uniref:polyprenyl synthetase family protein n=1 Tax=Microbacterium sp. cf332 TaxID=1761804 RepID=UPI0008891163|nr:polyprenyl synthetase family protein [Microbacterium sp. cf332]SDQ14606.1 geranylgeranyl diphosphate synthase, type II [Microbacterium sp. cf332]
MISLPEDDATAVDRALEAVLTRLTERAIPRGSSALALVRAAGAATAGGKRFRPALVVTAFDAFHGDRGRAPGLWDVAAAFELLHTAFVIHDDLIDRDTERRGVPNVGGTFRVHARSLGVDDAEASRVGDAAAVLAGDILLYEAARLVATADIAGDQRIPLFSLLDDAVLVSAIGELADVEQAVVPTEPGTAQLLSTAHDKTAVYSFCAPLAAGAVMAGADDGDRAVLMSVGADLGLAFQLVDDLIGTFGSAMQAGRGAGADLRESKRTPLISFARESASWPQVSSALAMAPTGPIAVQAAQRELDASGAREQLVTLIGQTLGSVRRRAAELPPTPRVLIEQLADGIEGRIP